MTHKRILLYLHAEQVSWLILDETGQTQQAMARGNLADLTPLVTAGIDIHVIVPGQDILLISAPLPKLNQQRTIQALPFALEEKLIDDVNNLHFALGEYQADNSFPVAVIAKEKMEDWLAELKQVNITPNALIPTTLALPFTPDNWYASIYDEMGIVRTGQYSGFACDKANLNAFLTIQLAETEQKPACVHLYNFSAAPTDIKLESTTLNEMTLPEEQFLEHLAKWTDSYPFINLLQGSYQVTQKTTATKKIWLLASCLMIVWFGLALFSNLGSYFILHHATAQTDLLINKIYMRNFPQASAVIAPRQRMEEKLKKFSAGTNKNYFLAVLGEISNNLTKAQGIQLHSLDFRGNQFTLSVSATTFDNLDAFTQSLTHQGLTVKQQNAGMAGNVVKANLLINQGAL